MISSPQGKRLSCFFYPGVRDLVASLAGLISIVNRIIPTQMEWLIMSATGHSKDMSRVLLERLLHRNVVYSALVLAHTEMEIVNDVNTVCN
jgi:hypothetical protein